MTKTLKIVLNKCYGGFTLSDAAIKRLDELKAFSDITKIPNESIENFNYRKSLSLERTNEKLIQVVEELGDRASGECSKLIVSMVDINIDIQSYDGMESVKVNGYSYHY